LTCWTVPLEATDEVVSTGFVEGDSGGWSGVGGKRRG